MDVWHWPIVKLQEFLNNFHRRYKSHTGRVEAKLGVVFQSLCAQLEHGVSFAYWNRMNGWKCLIGMLVSQVQRQQSVNTRSQQWLNYQWNIEARFILFWRWGKKKALEWTVMSCFRWTRLHHPLKGPFGAELQFNKISKQCNYMVLAKAPSNEAE